MNNHSFSSLLHAMNNDAVVNYLQRGEYEKSMTLFRQAMVQLRQALNNDTTSTSTNTNDAAASSPSSCDNDDEPHQDRSFQGIPMDEEDSAKLLTASPSNMFTLYPCAFIIECDQQEQQQRHSNKSPLELYVILIFNMALAHHLRGLHHPTACQSDLREALRCYKLGLSIVRRNAHLCSSSASGSSDLSRTTATTTTFYLVSLALLNNAGHLFSHFSHMLQAKSCLSRMEELLQASYMFNMSEEQSEFFHSNVFFSKSCNIKVAAAA